MQNALQLQSKHKVILPALPSIIQSSELKKIVHTIPWSMVGYKLCIVHPWLALQHVIVLKLQV